MSGRSLSSVVAKARKLLWNEVLARVHKRICFHLLNEWQRQIGIGKKKTFGFQIEISDVISVKLTSWISGVVRSDVHIIQLFFETQVYKIND